MSAMANIPNTNAVTITQWSTTIVSNATMLSNIQNTFVNTFGIKANVPDNATLAPASPTGALVQEFTDMAVNTANTMAYVTTNVYGLDTTNGLFLDGLGSLFDIRRATATYTTVTCSITGTVGTVIPFDASVSDGTYLYHPTSAITLTTPTQSAEFTCSTIGAIHVAANSIKTILTPIKGWASITNPNVGVTGKNIQNDTSYRYTIKYARYINARNCIQALYATLEKFMAQDGATTFTDSANNVYPLVKGFFVDANFTGADKTLSGLSNPLHANQVYISIYAPEYLSTTDAQQYVAGLILNQISNQTANLQLSLSNQYTVSYTNVLYPNLLPVVVKFDKPIATPIQFIFAITIYSASADPAALTVLIQQAIMSQFYFGYSGYTPENMNKTIYAIDYIKTIINVVGTCTITAHQVALQSGGTPAASLLLTLDKVATLAQNNINITITIAGR